MELNSNREKSKELLENKEELDKIEEEQIEKTEEEQDEFYRHIKQRLQEKINMYNEINKNKIDDEQNNSTMDIKQQLKELINIYVKIQKNKLKEEQGEKIYKKNKKKVNYNNTVIYKIYCKDTNIKDFYIGHSADFETRKASHISTSYSKQKYKCKLYHCISNNGGINNWDFEIIEKYPCENITEASKREQYWIDTLEPTLNVLPAYPLPGGFIAKKNKIRAYYKNRRR
jgi:hypothetical protein